MKNFQFIEANDFESLQKKIDLILKKISDIQFSTPEDVLDNNDVISRYKISSRTLQNWRDSGELKFSKAGKKCFYKIKDIEAFLDNRNRSNKN